MKKKQSEVRQRSNELGKERNGERRQLFELTIELSRDNR